MAVRVSISEGGGALRALERLRAEAPGGLRAGLLRAGFLVGRRIAQNIDRFKETPGTGRLARSFLTPQPIGAGAGGVSSVILGGSAPIYARIHEYGGTIRPRNGPYLVFQTADGKWHSVTEVTIREKRYARDAIDDQILQRKALEIVGVAVRRGFH